MSTVRIDGKVGKIAQILSPTEVAVNIGWRDGVKLGDVFAILATQELEVRDPDTNELLGKRDLEKARITVTEVQERWSVCTVEATSTLSTYSNLIALSRDGGGIVPEGAELQALPPEDRYVKPGDRVKLIAAGPRRYETSGLVETVFLPAVERAITKVGGVFNPISYNQGSMPADRWDAFLIQLQTELGNEWELYQNPNDPYASQEVTVQYVGSNSQRRNVPIQFKPIYYLHKGQRMVRPEFDSSTL